jgi:hypothetical protein
VIKADWGAKIQELSLLATRDHVSERRAQLRQAVALAAVGVEADLEVRLSTWPLHVLREGEEVGGGGGAWWLRARG